jgi:hypothetical protein
VGFLEKLNPNATPRSMAWRAAIDAGLAAAFLLLVSRSVHLPWSVVAALILLAGAFGLVREWQVPRK